MSTVADPKAFYSRAAAILSGALCITMLVGCANKVRELMPTPALFDLPTARTIFEDVPLERRTDYVDLLYITDRAPDESPDAELPYGQERARSVGFGSAQVRLLPPMTWDELQRHSLACPRERGIAMELGAVKELGRYSAGPYPVQATENGVSRDPTVVEHHRRSNAAL